MIINTPKDRLIIERHPNGKKSFEGAFKNGKEVGMHTYWHGNGLKQKEVNYVDGVKDGIYIEYCNMQRRLLECNYKGGELDGLCRTWYSGLHAKTKGSYKDGCKIGIHEEWYRYGAKKKEEIFTVNDKGMRESTWTSWYENGNKESEGRTAESKYGWMTLQDYWTTWWESGAIKSTTNSMSGRN